MNPFSGSIRYLGCSDVKFLTRVLIKKICYLDSQTLTSAELKLSGERNVYKVWIIRSAVVLIIPQSDKMIAGALNQTGLALDTTLFTYYGTLITHEFGPVSVSVWWKHT
jgi:hypothetical protein